MAENPTSDLVARIDQLQRELRELRQRVVAIERMVGTVGEHPSDHSTVRGKVAYDWQA